ncbi:MAG: calcium:proton antiporter [bacterium]
MSENRTLPSLLRTEAVLPMAAITLVLFTVFAGSWEAAPVQNVTRSLLLFGWIFLVLSWASFGVVRHAEGLAILLGEPIGTILLTLSVILIEVSMITAVTLTGEPNPTLARETMFSVVMIVLNALVGVSLIVGGLRHHSQAFSLRGAQAYLGTLFTLAGLGLVLPRFTTSTPDGSASPLLAGFLILMSLTVYCVFLAQQTLSHQSLFRMSEDAGNDHGEHLVRSIGVHAGLLVATMLLIVLLSKHFAVFVEAGVTSASLPPALGGILVATIVLTPEALAAIRAAAANNIQRSINLCLGSGLATIGLTIPEVLAVSLVTGRTMELGLEVQDIVILAITMLVSVTTFTAPRTTYLQGCLHLVLFLGYLLLVFD